MHISLASLPWDLSICTVYDSGFNVFSRDLFDDCDPSFTLSGHIHYNTTQLPGLGTPTLRNCTPYSSLSYETHAETSDLVLSVEPPILVYCINLWPHYLRAYPKKI
jgi:hypothetical protein